MKTARPETRLQARATNLQRVGLPFAISFVVGDFYVAQAWSMREWQRPTEGRPFPTYAANFGPEVLP